jgi:hypothetical protein
MSVSLMKGAGNRAKPVPGLHWLFCRKFPLGPNDTRKRNEIYTGPR